MPLPAGALPVPAARSGVGVKPVIGAIVLGGLVGGALDLLFAIAFAYVRGIAPVRVLQTVASGLLGSAAYAGGNASAVLGLVSHFALSLGWAALFAVACWRVPRLLRRPLLAGAAFGALVFLAMRLLVLPLSAYPAAVTFRPLATVLDLASHLFLFGAPIAWALARVLAVPVARHPSHRSPP